MVKVTASKTSRGGGARQKPAAKKTKKAAAAKKQEKATTAFQRRVYMATSYIPRGKVSTYGEIARMLDCKSAQAVGRALSVNPFAPTIPCHRVLSDNLHLTGYGGQKDAAALKKKADLLISEGRRGCAIVYPSNGQITCSMDLVFLKKGEISPKCVAVSEEDLENRIKSLNNGHK